MRPADDNLYEASREQVAALAHVVAVLAAGRQTFCRQRRYVRCAGIPASGGHAA